VYSYLILPAQPQLPPEDPYWSTNPGIIRFVEWQLAERSIYAEKSDLPDRRRVYRIDSTLMWKFDRDAKGPFVGRNRKPEYRFTDSDPTQVDLNASPWMPAL